MTSFTTPDVQAKIDQMKEAADAPAAAAFDEGLDEWSHNIRLAQSERDAYWAARQGIKGILQTTATRLGDVDWMLALEAALDLTRIAANDKSIEAPYSALLLISKWVDWQIAMADGFNAVEIKHAA